MAFLSRLGRRAVLIGVAILGGTFAFAGPTHAQETLSIAAVVNDDIISVFDLMTRLRSALVSSRLPDVPENRQRLLPQVLRSLIDDRLKVQEARRLKIDISDEELKDAVAKVEANNRLGPGGLRRAAEEMHVPYETLSDQIRAQVLWIKAIARLTGRGNRINITEEDVDERLAQLRESRGRPEHLVAEIFLPFDARNDEAQVRDLAAKLIAQIRAGAPFPVVARQFSASPSAARGGDLGWVPMGQLEPELDRALAAMPENTVSDPIQTLGGYYILDLRRRRIAGGTQRGDPQLTLSQIRLPESGPKALSAADRGKVIAYVGKSLRGCSAFDAYAEKLGTEGSGPLGSMRLGELTSTLRAAVENLPVGVPSAPADIGKVPTILMVCERHENDGLPTRDEVKRMLRDEALERYSERRLRDLRRLAVVDIRL